MKPYQLYLNWIEEQFEEQCQILIKWANINSGSLNRDGLHQMAQTLRDAFQVLEGDLSEIELSPMKTINSKGEEVSIQLGKALHIRKRPNASFQVFLGGHMDTVFAKDHPFQEVQQINKKVLNGPGVSDLKGGLVVLLTALEAFERSPFHQNIGWEVLINPDEEIGSLGSAPLFEQIAKRVDLGLIYEPTIDDQGTLAGARKGSGSFTIVVHGKSAHSGREFDKGRNAICALAECIGKLHALNQESSHIILNIGNIEGGGPINIVPDLAICRFNVRTQTVTDEKWVHQNLAKIMNEMNQRDGISFTLHGAFNRKPKQLDKKTQSLFKMVRHCGKELGHSIEWQATGGCCDGNNLAAAGLPNVDTMGVRGGKIHSDQEYVLLDSLTERTQLTALLLMSLGKGEVRF